MIFYTRIKDDMDDLCIDMKQKIISLPLYIVMYSYESKTY